MFIDEQAIASVYDLAPAFRDERWACERHVWSPVSCRHTHWVYEPLIVRGQQRRDPFIEQGESNAPH